MSSAPPMAGDAGTAPVGVVLAGGKSSRMGRDKASIRWPPTGAELGKAAHRDPAAVAPEHTLGRHALDRLARVTADLLVADGGNPTKSAPWRGDVPSAADGPGAGPAAGILGAASLRPGLRLLVLACDLPWIPVALLEELSRSTADLAVPVGPSGVEPLCALYGPRASEALAEAVGRGEMAPRALAEKPGTLEVERLEVGRLAAFGDPSAMFANLNYPSDLADHF
ncbi:MAG: molybdenum cofactor guanylyltransferase [Holophagales bacterium]|nr:molybdenum cofactor guanylyltransferase [Holophagales bacterium]